MRQIKITDKECNQRFDKFLLKYLNKASKSFIYKMLRKKRIKLNDSRAQGNEILSAGDVIKIYFSDETAEAFMEERSIKAFSDIDIIYEDENIIVCNKPQGALSHSESSEDADTMVDRLLLYLRNKNEYQPSKTSSFTPAICNRLDRNTSGILLCGKNLASVQALNRMIADRNTEKYYLAFVTGKITAPGVLNGFYSKDRNINKAVIINDAGARDVLAEYRPLKNAEQYSLLELRLITGKSHQLRAHLAAIAHPIAGDPKYGDALINSEIYSRLGVKYQMLHASRFIIKERQGYLNYLYDKEFICEAPPVFYQAIKYFKLF